MEILCYGCGRGEHPENTLEAIAHCQKINPDWYIDLDVQITKDEEIVLFHDYNAQQRTGVNAAIFDLTLDEIKQLNAGYYFKKGDDFPYRENPIKIPTLKEVCQTFPNAKLIVDIHTNNLNAIDRIIAIIENHNMENQIVIVSHYDAVITQFKLKRAQWTFGAATKEVKKMVFSSFLFLDYFFPLQSDVLLMPVKFKNMTLLTSRVIRHVKKRNKKLWVWLYEGKENDELKAVKTKIELLALKARGVDGIYTEHPEELSTEMFS